MTQLQSKLESNRLQSLVGWDFAHWGDRHCLAQNARLAFRCSKKEAGTFANRQDVYSAYERYSSIKVAKSRFQVETE